MEVEFYAYEKLGYIIDPPSETKVVFIPSPPTMTTVKINPRKVIIYVTGGKVTEGYEKLDALKEYAEENKIMIICPEAVEAEELAETYEYALKKAKTLNIKGNEIVVMGDVDYVKAAQGLVDYVVDELDANLEDAKEFIF